MKRLLWVVFLASSLNACMATTGNYRSLNEHNAARPPDCDVAIFKDQLPAKPYVAISRLNVHLEKTFFTPSDFSSASGELRRQACLSGADGVIDIEEKKSSFLETRIYNLSATGIRFIDRTSVQ
ncbi:hypothetical protein [Dyella sp. RRB7]|uniref:hypothetical protein n=1 Tax=Dyella sp. RRB7 TaxID=2919502 RepID=UPI001FAA93B7|nr:hypothetical protein [Dyella sp. RRB7]